MSKVCKTLSGFLRASSKATDGLLAALREVSFAITGIKGFRAFGRDSLRKQGRRLFSTFLLTVIGGLIAPSVAVAAIELKPGLEESNHLSLPLIPAKEVTVSYRGGASVLDAIVDTNYHVQFEASGGSAPYDYTLWGGTLPDGLSLNRTTGEVTGVAKTLGSFLVRVEATDRKGLSGGLDVVIRVLKPTLVVSPLDLTQGKVGLNVGLHKINVSGGTAPYTYEAINLPEGLTLNGDTVSGTPTKAGSFDVTIKVKDKKNYPGENTQTLFIAEKPTITVSYRDGSSVPDTTYGADYRAQFDATGGTAPYVYTVEKGVLPKGLSLDSTTGEITGAAQETGDFRFHVVATDKDGYRGDRNTLISVSKPTIVIDPASLPAGKVRLDYGSHPLTASGGTAPYTYKVYDASKLPPGLSLDPSTGVLSGTPSTPGDYTFWLGATDANEFGGESTGTNGWRKYSVTIAPAPTITVDMSDLPGGKVGLAYGSHKVSASGGTAPYTYEAVNLPEGLTLKGDTVSGMPTKADSFDVTIKVKDKENYPGENSRTITIAEKPTIIVDTSGFHRGYKGVDYGLVTVTATGGTAPYTYEFTGLPTGLTGNKNGTVSGTTTSVGPVTVTIKVKDADGYVKPATVNFGVWNAPTVADIPNGKQNLDYDPYTVTATGGPGSYTYQIKNLPEGLTAKDNVISGKPAKAGSFSISVMVTDDDHNTLPFEKTITIAPAPTIAVDMADLPGGKVGLPYGSHKVSASGGTAPYTYEAINLPEGLTLKGDTVSGTPTKAGSFNVTIKVKDKENYPGENSRTLTIAEKPTITVNLSDLPAGKVGLDYGSHKVSASGGTAPYTYEAINLPEGLTLNGDTVSGMPTKAGSFDVTIKAKDKENYPGENTQTLFIAEKPTITVSYRDGSSVPDTTYGADYRAQFDATGGTAPYVYTVEKGVLPKGLSLDSTTGEITGATQETGDFRFHVVATDKDGYRGDRNTLISVSKPTIVIDPASLPAGKVRLDYGSHPLTASGGTAPYTYKVYDASKLPPGLSLDPSTGVLSGTPSTPGDYTFWLGATDANEFGGESTGTNGWRKYSVTIAPAPTITVDMSDLPGGKVGLPYGSHKVSASGGTAPYTYEAVNLPEGLTLDGDTVSGTPTKAGSFDVTIKVKDKENYPRENSRTLTIAEKPTITVNLSDLPAGKVGLDYGSHKVSASGGTAPYTYEAINLPEGLTLNGDTVSGMPTKAGSFAVTIKVKDKENYPGENSQTLTIAEKPTITVNLSDLPAGKVGLAYGSHKVSASGGTAPYTYEAINLPEGLTLNGDTVSGTPTKAGSFAVTIKVKDKEDYPGENSRTITIAEKPTITVNLSDLPTGKAGLDYGSHKVSASGGTAPYTYEAINLPEGLTLNGDTISGTPTKADSFDVTIKVKDKENYPGENSRTITIAEKPTIIVDTSGFHRGYKGVDYGLVTVTATGGTAPYTYEFTGLPTGLTGNKNGTVSGTTTYVGPVTVTIKVKDADGYVKPATVNFGVWNAPTVADIPNGKQNLDYDPYTVTATGGPGSYTYQIKNLPEGLTAKDNVISGKPTKAGSFSISVMVTDNDHNTFPFEKTITIAPAPTIAVDMADLPGGKVGLPYGSHKVSASGGTAPYTYEAINLPEGLTLKGDTISGTPTKAGSFDVTIKVKDKENYPGENSRTLTIAEKPTITVNLSDLPAGKVGLDYGSHKVSASGGTAPYTYEAINLPEGLTLNGDTVSGTPTKAGSFDVTIKVKDKENYPGENSRTITIAEKPAITVNLSDLPAGKVGLPYGSHKISASGGTAPYTYEAINLPEGLTLNGDTISGMPTKAGSFAVTIKVKDKENYPGENSRTLTIAEKPTITVNLSDLPAGKVGLAYGSHKVSASGGTAPYTYEAINLPEGLTLNGDTISGTPTKAGSFDVTIKVKDKENYPGENSQTLFIAEKPTITVNLSDLPAGKVGLDYGSHKVSASGGTAPYTYEAINLPEGLTFDGDTVSGTPTKAGSFAVTIKVKDKENYPGENSQTLTIAEKPTITVNLSDLPAGKVGLAYGSHKVSASGGTAPYTYEAINLPEGLTLNGDTISGTPTKAGSFDITIKAKDKEDYPGENSRTLTIAEKPTITVNLSDLPAGKVGLAYGSHKVSASGGTAPYTYEAINLPEGLTLKGDTVSGTPTKAGSFDVTIKVKDKENYPGENSRTLTIAEKPTITVNLSDLPTGKVGLDYGSHKVSASGGTAPYTYEAINLPEGLTLNGDTVSGTPTKAGSFAVTIKVKDKENYPGENTRTLTIAEKPTITVNLSDLPGGKVGLDYGSHKISASGGTAPYTYEAINLPEGLTLNGDTVSGTPTKAGSFDVTIKVKDKENYPGENSRTLTIAEKPTITVNLSDLPAGKVGLDYGSHKVSASGGTAPYTYEAINLPEGLTFDGDTVSGTPTKAGSFAVTIKVKDKENYPGENSQTLTIAEKPTITVNLSDLPAGKVGLAYGSHKVSASGGTAPYTYEAVNLPEGLTLNGDTVSGMPTKAGSFAVTIKVKDKENYPGENSRTLTIAEKPTITVNLSDLPAGKVGLDYGSHKVSASGGTAPYTYEAINLPEGLTLNGDTISGMPTKAGSFDVTIKVKDKENYPGENSRTLIIEEKPTITVNLPDLPAGKVGLDYGSHKLSASGGTAPYTYEAVNLPEGLTLNGDTLSGMPTKAGSFDVTIKVKDKENYPGENTQTIVIVEKPTIKISYRGGSSIPDTDYGNSYRVQLEASGGTAPYTYRVTKGVLPNGLSLESKTGKITGIAKKSGDFKFQVTAKDADGFIGERSMRILVSDPKLVIDVSAIPTQGRVGLEFGSYKINASGGIAPYRYEVTGLPDGLTLNGDTISGKPTKAGSFPVAVVATDAGDCKQKVQLTLTIAPASVINIDVSKLRAGEVGLIYGPHKVSASGGKAPYRYEISGLPEGLVANGDTISGTPIKAGSFNIIVHAKDADGYTAQAQLKLEIARPRIEAKDHILTVMAGATGTVNLLEGATGMPITGATIVASPDAASGQARIAQVGGGYTLYFSASPFFAGSTSLKYTLSNAHGSSAPAVVTITVIARPDPSKDPEVIGLTTAQVETTSRMTRTQIRNFEHRLEQLHGRPECRENDIGFNLGLDGADLHPKLGGKPGCGEHQRDFSLWTNGEVSTGRSGNHRDRRIQHASAGVSGGIDYRFSPSFIGGAGLGYGRDVSDVGTKGTQSHATMFSLTTYGSYHPTENTFVDGVVGYGWLNFNNKRHVTPTGDMATGKREGQQLFGAVSLGYEYRNEGLLLSPYVRSDVAHAKLSGFKESGAGIYNLTYGDQTIDMLSASVAMRGEYAIPMKWGMLRPRGRLEYTHDFSSAGKARMGYSDMGGLLPYSVDTKRDRRGSLNIEAGIDADLDNGWKMGLDYGTQFSKGGGTRQQNFSLKLSKEF